jgi:hypothetical protein
MKLNVIYSGEGQAVADLRVQDWLDDLLSRLEHCGLESHTIDVGTDVMVSIIRLAVIEGRLDHEDVTFYFEDYIITVDENGMFNLSPKGFCDTLTEISRKLLEKNKEKQHEV